MAAGAPRTPRTPRLTARYFAALSRLKIRPTDRAAVAIGRSIAALSSAAVLPGPLDVEAPVPPTNVAYVRRVPNHNIWIWYTLAPGEVAIITLTNAPPAPRAG